MLINIGQDPVSSAPSTATITTDTSPILKPQSREPIVAPPPEEKVPEPQPKATEKPTDAPTDPPTTAPPATTESPATETPVARRSMGNDNCPTMRSLAKALLALPNDIQLLLGILRAYIDDSDTVLELGSRQGSSTAMILESAPRRFATVDLYITKAVSTMHAYGRQCTKSKPEDYFTVQGDDLDVPIPFEKEKVEMMFLDTLHASWLLEHELRRYPPIVTNYMAFHDSYSYTFHDEVYPNVRERRNDKNRGWKGLKVAFDDFVRTHKDEWVEDMSYIHNNGLYVLRRRSYVPQMPTPTGDIDLEANVESDLSATLGAQGECKQLMNSIGCNEHYICDHVPMFYRPTSLTDGYARLCGGQSPLARQLPVIFGYGIAVTTFRVMECTTSVMLAALHAALSNDRVMYVAKALNPGNCPALKRLQDHVPAEYRRIRFDDDATVDLVITKSGVSSDFKGRVYVLEYGTTLVASKRSADDSFELHSVLRQKPGLAIWKKKGAMDFNYIKL